MIGKKRSPIAVLLLSLLTCGLYFIYWQYVIMNEMGDYLGEEINPLKELFFIVITCGLYGIYLYYKYGKWVYKCTLKGNIEASDNSLLYVICSIFGLGIVVSCFMQNTLNQVWENSSY